LKEEGDRKKDRPAKHRLDQPVSQTTTEKKNRRNVNSIPSFSFTVSDDDFRVYSNYFFDENQGIRN
jgi:hypothetical protein